MRMWKWVGVVTALGLGCAYATLGAEEKSLGDQVKEQIQVFKNDDAKVAKLFDTAYGYAVFPSIGKGAVGIGGAAGDGQVFEKGQLIGTARMTQITVGAQLGGQKYAEVIFFENKDTMDSFKGSEWAMSAAANAVAAGESASADAKYKQGVLVYTIAKAGLMFEASVGGQKFKFTPLSKN